ncbi:hypothetical protein ABPG74_000358 [Tetrahymena malaccensis]
MSYYYQNLENFAKSNLQQCSYKLSFVNFQDANGTLLLNTLTQCQNLKKISMNFNYIMDFSQEEWNQFKILESLYEENNLKDKTISNIINNLNICMNLKILSLGIENIPFTSIEVKNLIIGASKIQILENLTLSFNKSFFDEQSMAYLAEEIINCQNLNTLALRFQQELITALSINNLFDQICKIKQLESLKIEIIQNMKDKFSFYEVINQITKVSNLKNLKLNLSFNQINYGKEVGDQIMKFENIKSLELNLDSTNMKDDQFSILCGQLLRFKSLFNLSLSLRANELGDSSTLSLSQFLKSTSNIKIFTFDLRDNLICLECNKYLQSFLESLSNLYSLNLFYTQFQLSSIEKQIKKKAKRLIQYDRIFDKLDEENYIYHQKYVVQQNWKYDHEKTHFQKIQYQDYDYDYDYEDLF